MIPGFDGAAVGLDDGLCDRESKTRTGGAGIAAAIELVEETIFISFGKAGSMIANLNPDKLVPQFGCDLDG